MKKKKKTLYIRRIRVNLKKKKTIIYLVENFVFRFNTFFRRRFVLLKKRSFIRFLNRFELTNLAKVLNFIKIFGMHKSYKMFNFEYKSKMSKILFLKFKKKNKSKKFHIKKKVKSEKWKTKTKTKTKRKVIKSKKENDRKKNIDIIKLKFFFLFDEYRKYKKQKKQNIAFKKSLCLYFSYRHMMYLPVRGQRTRTNAKTRKDFYVT